MGKIWETSNTDMSNKNCAEFVRHIPHKTCHVDLLSCLTLRLLMLYIYGAPSKARNANVVYIYIYGPTFGNTETVSFYLLHNVSTLFQTLCSK